jgi:predicted RNA-binding protein with PUA-like domain
MANWLMKSEPDAFSIDHLRDAPKQTTMWDGVRNFQVRNMMRDEMRPGDRVFYYHSNCKVPGIYGIAEIASEAAYPDPTQFDPDDGHFDPTSDPADPRWLLVDVRYVQHLANPVGLADLRQAAGRLGDFALLRRANRLSVMPVSDAQWDTIMVMSQG